MTNFLFRNWGIKIFCLFIAGGLWVYAASAENKTDFYPGKIPIVPKNVAKNLAPVYDKDEIQVKIMASSQSWKELATDSFTAYVDLANLSIGTHEVEVKVVSSVPGVQIIEKNPEKILVKMEAVATKEVRVEAKISGNPAEDYEMGDAIIKPISVEARGARSVIDDLIKATAQVNLESNASSYEEDVKLLALDINEKPMRFITFTPERVHISIPIAKISGGKILGVRANVTGSPSSGFWLSKIEVEPTSVVVNGDAQKLKSVDYLETKEINIAGIQAQKQYVVTLKLPDGISLAASEPKNIKVTVKVSQVASSREIIAGVSYTGLGDGLKVASIQPNIIKVMVTGMFNTLGILSSDNVVANLNLSGKKAGTYKVTIQSGDISTPPGTAISSVVPSQVSVQIK